MQEQLFCAVKISRLTVIGLVLLWTLRGHSSFSILLQQSVYLRPLIAGFYKQMRLMSIVEITACAIFLHDNVSLCRFLYARDNSMPE